tara:strand:+ start:993 stop:1643 length:651 start_codon:yes stop_codon:yes gene_type:complete
MKQAILKTKIVPLLAVSICYILYLLGYFQILIGTFVVLIASLIEFRKDIFKSLGFQKKGLNIKNLLLIAPLISGGLFLLYYFVLVPGVTYITGQAMDFSAFDSFNGNLPATLGLLVFIWVSAGFGEEILFRGYLMKQFIKFFGKSKVSLLINILLLGIIFGWLHSYQGITGQIITGIIGILLAIIFYIRKYDLWFNVAVHGFFDTIALVFIYYGWY